MSRALLVAVLLAAAPVHAAEPLDYAYLFVQGKLTLHADGRPEVGATLRLTDGAESHSAVTDDRGFFTFERLPRGIYDLELTTRDGERIRRARRIDTAELGFTLAALDVGRGTTSPVETLRVTSEGERAVVRVPEAAAAWGRLRRQAFVFVGIAVLLAL